MVKKNVNDNEARMQSGKDAMSRCSSTYFRKIMNKLEPKLNERQRARIISTPFANWLKMPKLSIYSTRVDVILKSFNSDSSSFVFGKGIVVPFTSFEFSIVLGLPHGGQPVNQDLGTKSNFLSRYFAGKLSKAMRKTISENLLLLAESDDESQLDDFVRMFILFAMNCIVFPLSTYLTPRFVFSYIDDLPNFFGYSWGDAAHRFLCDQISAHVGNLEGAIGRKTYLDGCVVGMMAWVYEKIPSLGVVFGSPRTYPRLFKWGESKIPLKVEEAETLLKRITQTKVYEIIPFGEELELFGHRRRNVKVSSKMKDEEITCKIRRLEKLVEDQFHEIQILKQMCCQSNENMAKDGGDGRVDVKIDAGKNDDKNGSFEDFDTELGGYNEIHDVDVVIELNKGDDVCFTKLDMELNKVPMEDSSREVVDERDDGYGVTSSQEDKINNVISSIVKNVTTRTDRVKKRKPNMFVTPPSSTPRRKTKSTVECKEYRVISDEGGTSVEDEKITADKDESKLKNFRGRQDFCGCEEVSDEERNIIIKYLTGEKLSGTVWEGERFKICSIEFCDLLFGDALKDNIINCYMQIVSGSEIFCMDTTVQDEVLGALQRLNKKRKLKDDGYHDFLSHLTHDSRGKLEQLNRKLIDRCRFLLFPIHAKYHWFLLVYNTEKREFEFRNSIYTAMSLGTARAYAKFLVGYMRIFFDYKTKEYVNQVFCRQQGVDMNCGVYLCLWAYCYARDDDEAWTYEKDCKMNTVRARIAATILSDSNGVFGKDG